MLRGRTGADDDDVAQFLGVEQIAEPEAAGEGAIAVILVHKVLQE
jgi:hypothetical protein